MEWTDDVTAGDWIRERTDAWRGTIHDVVPRGFPAYARVLHRPHVRFLRGGRMVPHEEWVRLPDAEQHDRARRMITEPSTWAETAAAFGTQVHAEAQWNRLVRTPTDASGWQSVIAPDGREFEAPSEGQLDADLLAVVAEHLAAHTTTADAGYVAVWEGWGDIVGHLGTAPSGTFLSYIADDAPIDPEVAHHNAMLARSIHDPFNNVFRKPVWQPGSLSDEISRGARLELPGRDYVLFRGGVAELADPDWMLQVPWRNRPREEHGFPPSAHSPSLVWPDGRAWMLVTEVDFDSTIVAGTPELVRALCTDPRLEAFALRADADLTWTGDRINP